MKQLIDMTGQTIGLWKVIKRGPNTAQGQAQWICVCSRCENLKIVKGSHLREKRSTKCKQCHNETFNRRHGRYKTKAYKVWEEMIQRCSNPRHPHFVNYGQRGIYVCDDWKNDFINFWASMGDPAPGMSLDRIDNNGPYCAENCRWSDRSAQQRNTRRSHRPGNIYGDWRLLENTPYKKSSVFACIRCGRTRTTETFYVTSGKAASCGCT